MTEIELPGLRNDEALGFLAALGLTSVLELGIGSAPRLGWVGVGEPAVLVLGDGWDFDRVVVALEEYVNRLDNEHMLHPDIEGFPLVKQGAGGSDPMRMEPSDAVALARFAGEQERTASAAWARWFVGAVNQCGRRQRDEGDQALSSLYAPSGNMTFDRNFDKARKAVDRHPDQLRSALRGWRRVDGFAGANLDYRAERSAQATQDHKVGNLGVPGPTWLALMSMPQFRLTGDGIHPRSTLFQRPPGRGREVMVWPLWRRPIGPNALRVLIEHPALQLRRRDGGMELVHEDQLRALGVEAVAWAQRSSLGNSDGPIGPATILPVP